MRQSVTCPSEVIKKQFEILLTGLKRVKKENPTLILKRFYGYDQWLLSLIEMRFNYSSIDLFYLYFPTFFISNEILDSDDTMIIDW